MTDVELAPRRTIGSVVAVWITAAVLGIAIGAFVPPDWRSAWLTVGFGGILLLTFSVQLAVGRVRGFIARVAASVLGALVVLGILGLGFSLASIVPSS